MVNRPIRSESQALAERLQEGIYTIGSLAEILSEDAAYEGSEPGPRLSVQGQASIHFAILTISKCAQEDLIALLEDLQVPALGQSLTGATSSGCLPPESESK